MNSVGLGWITVVLACLFAILFGVAVVVLAWHYLTPDAWAWLSSDKISKLQSMVFSGSAGAFVVNIMRVQFGKVS